MVFRNLNWGPGDVGDGSGRVGGANSTNFFFQKDKSLVKSFNSDSRPTPVRVAIKSNHDILP